MSFTIQIFKLEVFEQPSYAYWSSAQVLFLSFYLNINLKQFSFLIKLQALPNIKKLFSADLKITK